jgi:hypothetical protein
MDIEALAGIPQVGTALRSVRPLIPVMLRPAFLKIVNAYHIASPGVDVQKE